MRRLISVLAAALLLTGCVEVPENIVKEKESREAVSQYVPEESSGKGSGTKKYPQLKAAGFF